MRRIANAEGLSDRAVESLAHHDDSEIRRSARAELDRRDREAITEALAAVVEVDAFAEVSRR